MSTIAPAIAASALASFATAYCLVMTAGRHGRFTMDWPGGTQKVHTQPTPRIGGIGIYAALAFASLFAIGHEASAILRVVLVAALPAVLAGLLEDVTGRIPPQVRLTATLASGVWACWASGVALQAVDVAAIDWMLALPPVAVMFTALCVAGVTNAINMIDGFHGLASGTAALGFAALAAIAAQAGDTALASCCLLLLASVAGFWAVNFPWGKLFLGDGGAYLVGFALAWMAVLLPARNPSVSPWACLLVCAYPVTEVLYSMLRRWVAGQRATHPDREHLHSLVADRVTRSSARELPPELQNAAVSLVMWPFAALPALAAVLLYNHGMVLVICAIAFALLYHCAYERLAHHE